MFDDDGDDDGDVRREGVEPDFDFELGGIGDISVGDEGAGDGAGGTGSGRGRREGAAGAGGSWEGRGFKDLELGVGVVAGEVGRLLLLVVVLRGVYLGVGFLEAGSLPVARVVVEVVVSRVGR